MYLTRSSRIRGEGVYGVAGVCLCGTAEVMTFFSARTFFGRVERIRKREGPSPIYNQYLASRTSALDLRGPS